MQYRKTFFPDARRSTGCVPLRRAALWSALVFSSSIVLPPCFAQAEPLTISFPAQPLAAALDSLAKQTGIKLNYAPEMVKGEHAPALAGRLTADEALGRLLAGSGLTYAKTEEAYAITPASNETAKAAKEETVAQLPLIVVSEKTEETGYITRRASTATKTNTPIMLTPFSIQVVPKEVIQDQQAIRLEDVTKNVSGVQTNWGYGGLYEGFALRGFETNNILRNGQRIGGGFGRSSIDMANIEMVEVLKGPAAMIYGRLDPGGMINVVTKKPLATPYYSIQQQFGSFNTFRTTADATGRINSDGTLLYRINFEYLDANSFRPRAPHTYSTFIAPSLSWRPNSDLEVNLNYEHRNLEPSLDNGVPAIGNRPANISIKTYGGDIRDKAIVNRNLVDFNWAYAINPSWKVRNGLTGTFETINFKQSYFPSFIDNSIPGTLIVNNSPWIGLRQSQGFNTFFDVTGNLSIWGTEHTLLAGTDYYVLDHRDTEYVAGFGVVDTIDLLHPTYNRTTNPANLRAQPPDFLSVGRQEWNGLYLQDQIRLWDRVHLLLGGRYDWAQSTRGTVVTEFSPTNSFADL
jgi:iron complex outermembrane recepter protein